MKSKPRIRELLLVIAIIISIVLIFGLASSIFLSNTTLDIALHDTYFAIARRLLLIPVLLLSITFIYLAKEAFYKYRRRSQNLVLLTSLFLTNIYLLFCAKFAAILSTLKKGWTIYPPLSALPQRAPYDPLQPSPAFNNMWHIILIIQIIFMVILVIIAVITGKNWNINKRER